MSRHVVCYNYRGIPMVIFALMKSLKHAREPYMAYMDLHH